MNNEERLLRAIFDYQPADEAAEAKLRGIKAHKALKSAPELAGWLRELAIPSDGRTEHGETPTDRTPLLTGIVDAADDLFATLLDWSTWWAGDLDVQQPVAVTYARRNYQSSHEGRGYLDASLEGFHASTSPEMARALTGSLTVWLLNLELAISRRPSAATYQDDVTGIVWRLRAQSRLSPARPIRESLARRCPVCRANTMRAEFFGGSFQAAEVRGEALLDAVHGIDVRCADCGYTVPASAAKIARWIS